MQKPTLLGVEGQAQKIIEGYNAGVCYKPEDEVDFLYKLHKITNQDSYIDLQNGCDKLIENISRMYNNDLLNLNNDPKFNETITLKYPEYKCNTVLKDMSNHLYIYKLRII